MTDQKNQGKRLEAARIAAGYRSAREAALDNGWKEPTYRSHERGGRTMGKDDAEKYARRFRAKGADVSAQTILFGDEIEAAAKLEHTLEIRGSVGAGAAIDTEFEQGPPEGFEHVELPFPISEEFIGFRVKGDSMMPAYEDREIVVVDRYPTRAESLIGDRVVVLAEGPNKEMLRYLKRISRRRDQKPGTYDLESINDRSPTIRDVKILQASPVRMAIPNIGVRRLPKMMKTSKRSQR